MKAFARFLSTNNLVPITLGVLFLGAGSLFAAQNPERIYAVENRVVAIDNTYLVQLDLAAFSPTARVTDVREDEEAYYVSYDLATVGLVDSVWRDTVKSLTLTVYKDMLADYRDLGAYVSLQLRQVIEREQTKLKRTQAFEKDQVSQKQITTARSGLVGMFMDDTTETLPPYTKEEIPEPPRPPRTVVETERAPVARDDSPTVAVSEPEPEPERLASAPETTTPADEPRGTTSDEIQLPYLSLLGSSTVELAVGASYVDLGVVVHDSYNTSPELHTFLDGVLVEKVIVDTATSTDYVVKYELSIDGEVVDMLERQLQVVATSTDQSQKEPEEETDTVNQDDHDETLGAEDETATSSTPGPDVPTPEAPKSTTTESDTEVSTSSEQKPVVELETGVEEVEDEVEEEPEDVEVEEGDGEV